MVDIFFIANRASTAWVTQAIPPADLLERIRSGCWRLPAELSGCLGAARQGKLRAKAAGNLVVVRLENGPPGTWVGQKDPAPGLSVTDRRLLEWVRAGLSDDQIALRCGRSPRWVRLQLARIRRLRGLPQRPRGTRRYR